MREAIEALELEIDEEELVGEMVLVDDEGRVQEVDTFQQLEEDGKRRRGLRLADMFRNPLQGYLDAFAELFVQPEDVVRAAR